MKQNKRKISQDTTLAELLKIKGAEKVLAKHGVPCITCPFAAMEMNELQIGKVCQTYGLNAKKIIEDLNNL